MKALVIAAAAGLACSASSTRVAPLPCPATGLTPSSLRPIAEQPTPIELFVPPLPIPADVLHHRSTIRVVVDSPGRVRPDSITICGISNARYIARLAQAVGELRFVPGRRADLPIAGPALIVYDF